MPNYGEYNADGLAKSDINYNQSELESSLTDFHETFHRYLTENSTYGLFICLIHMVEDADVTSKELKNKLNALAKCLTSYMLVIQESIAISCELMLCRKKNEEEYKRRLVEYRNDIHYGKECGFRKYSYYIDKPDEQEAMESLLKLIDIAKCSLSIDLREFSLNNLKLEKQLIRHDKVKKINPNHRFKIIIDKIFEQKLNLLDLDVKEFCKSIDLDVTELDNDIFKDWATENLLLPNKLLPFEEYMRIETVATASLQYYLDGLSPYVSDSTFHTVVCKKKEEWIQNNSKKNILYITSYIEGVYDVISADVNLGHQYRCKVESLDGIVLDGQLIYIDRHYYEAVLATYKFDCQIVFVNLNHFDSYCKEFVDKYQTSKKCFFYRLNEQYWTIFATASERTYFVKVVKHKQLIYLIKKYLMEYEYVNADMDTAQDGIFYRTEEDWIKYEDFLLFIMQRKYEDLTDACRDYFHRNALTKETWDQLKMYQE